MRKAHITCSVRKSRRERDKREKQEAKRLKRQSRKQKQPATGNVVTEARCE